MNRAMERHTGRLTPLDTWIVCSRVLGVLVALVLVWAVIPYWHV